MAVLVSCFRCSKPLMMSEEKIAAGQIPYCANCRAAQGIEEAPDPATDQLAAGKTKVKVRTKVVAKKKAAGTVGQAGGAGAESTPAARAGLLIIGLCVMGGFTVVVLLAGAVLFVVLTGGLKDPDPSAGPNSNPSTDARPGWPTVDVVPNEPPPQVNPNKEARPAAVKEQRTIPVSPTTVSSVTFSPDGSIFVTASGSLGRPGQIRFWQPTTGMASPVQVSPGSDILGVAFRPDGKLLASASGTKGLQFVNAAGTVVGGYLHPSYVRGVAFSPDGSNLASACERQLKVFSLTAQREQWSFNLEPGLQPYRVSMRIAFSPDNKTVAFGNGGNEVVACDAGTGELILKYEGHLQPVLCTAYAPNGKYLVSGGIDETIRVWDPVTGQTMKELQGHRGPVYSVAFARDNRTLASAGKDGKVILWDVASGKQVAALEAHKKPACCVAFSPNSNTLASSGVDGTVRLWDVSRVVGEP